MFGLKRRESASWFLTIMGWALTIVGIGLIELYASLWLLTSSLTRWAWAACALAYAGLVVVFVKKSWEEIFPWVSKKTPTSLSTSLSLSPSSWAQYIYQFSNQASNPSPNVSPSLPEFTAETPLIGFRAWIEKDDGLLWSINGHAAWSIDRTVAKCTPELGRPYMLTYPGSGNPTPCQDPPVPTHTCGLYLLSKPEEVGLVAVAVKAEGRLYGAVITWGRIVRHGTQGFRAQYAKPLCLTMPEWTPLYDRSVYDRAQARTERAAKAYGVPVIPSVRLREYVAEFGTTADKLAIPEKATA